MSKKTKDWQESCIDYVIGRSLGGSRNGNNRTRREEMQTYYDLYNSIYNEKDLKYVTNPFKQQDGFPAMAQDYNIIKPKIDLLLGEETKRPFNFKVVRTSDIAASEMQDKAKQLLIDYIQATIMSKLGPEEQARYQEALQNGEIMTPQQIQKYMSKDYKDIAEITAYHSLNYLKNKLNITHEFFKGWKDALVGGEEIYYVGILNGEPCLERVNPIYFDYDTETSDLEFIHDAEWCCYEMNMSVTELYDRLYDKMSEKQLNQLLDMMDQASKGGINPEVRKTSLDYTHIKTHTINGFSSNPFDSTNSVKVWHCCWKSFKKIGFVTIIDPELGEPKEYQVDESYKETGMELNVEWKWITEVWEGYRAGEDLYIGIQPLEYQYTSSDNPNSQRLPYTGVVYNNTNSRPRSLVSMMKPLQYMYIVLWYRLELAMARDKGKVVNMDITQIPKSMNIDVSKWMHYLSALGVNFINPYEEGWDIPGREGGKCHIKGTQIIMADGSRKKVEDIKLFDKVMGPDNKPRTVLELHHGKDHMYKITPSSGGQPQIVNSKHEIYYGLKNHHTGEVEFKTNTPVTLLERFTKTPSCRDKYFLYRKDGLDFGDTGNSFDPYLLGLWLGDGTSSKPTITTADYEIMDYLEQFALDNNMKIRYDKVKGEKALNVSLSLTNDSQRGYRNKPTNYLIQNLKKLGVFKNKHIPKSYIYCCESDRLELLAGLIDSDGWYDPVKKRFGFCQVDYRKDIALDFAFIARSLGMKVSVRKKKCAPSKLCKNTSENSYVVSILSGCERIPTKIARKQAKGDKFWQKDINRSMFNIEYYGIDEYYGFTLDKDSLFLLDDFTICHNSSTFNQITALDLTMANTIDQYINLMDKIESMLSEISGVSKQREGSISSNESVGNVERSVVQSAHITEPWFWTHNQVKRECLTMLLNTARWAWKDGSKTHLQYILDDATRAFLTLSDDMLYEDFDIFIEDTTKNQQYIETLKQLMQPAMQNGASLLDIAEIITMDNISMIKSRLEEIEQKRMEQQQAMEQAQAEREQQAIQMQNEIKEEELMIKEAEMDLEKYKIDQDNATKITVAQLNAYRGTENMDQNENGVPDVMEIAQQALAERKQASDEASKQFEFNAKIREQKMKKEIEDKKNQLERERMDHEMKLQAAKDKAAMERERLKAKTAIKNKVTGEK